MVTKNRQYWASLSAFHQKVTLADGTVLSDWTVIRTECHTSYSNEGSGSTTFYSNALEGSTGGGSTSGSLSQLLGLGYISDYWSRLNSYEKDYFTNNYWLLPGAALAFKEAEWFVNLLYCRNDDDGNWNAFKHAFWSAMLCVNVGAFQALIITDIHEYHDDIDYSVSPAEQAIFDTRNEMDFKNNQLGINTYKAMKNAITYLTYPQSLVAIMDAIRDKISEGAGTRIQTDSNGRALIPLKTLPTTNENRCR